MCIAAGVAEEVLGLDRTDPSTRAIKRLCVSELKAIAESGTFKKSDASSPNGSLLWSILIMISKFMYAETQAVEGLNSIVKLLGRRCPNISLELLSSRLTIKHLLGQADGVTACGKKFSTIKALAERELTELSDFATASLSILADAQRWSSAPALEFPDFTGSSGSSSAIQDAGDGAKPPPPPHPAEAAAVAVEPTQNCSLQIADLLSRGIMPNANLFLGDVWGPRWEKAVAWARSYNLGYKWTTGGCSGRMRKLSKKQQDKVKQLHTPAGLALLIVPSVDNTETTFHVATDQFSHSVCFSRLQIFKCRAADTDTHDVCECVRWLHDGSNYADTVESTLLFGKYYDACVRGESFSVRAAFLTVDMCEQLFTSPGYLRVDAVLGASVELFVMRKTLMPGAANKPKKAKAKAKGEAQPAAPEHTDKALKDDGDDDDGGDAADDQDRAYMSIAADADMMDASGSEGGDDEHMEDKDVEQDNEDAAEHEHQEINRAMAREDRQDRPSSREVARVAGAVAFGSCSQTQAELEEEALLLLVRQRNQRKHSLPGTDKVAVFLEGVGDADVASSLADNAHADDSADSASDDADEASSAAACAAQFLVDHDANDCDGDTQTMNMDSDMDMDTWFLSESASNAWAYSCMNTIKALRAVCAMQCNRKLGESRSISLVLMSPQKFDDCRCVRCRWGQPMNGNADANTDVPELLWVTWLNNHPTHGVLERRARHVNLDQDSKVLYCVADTTYARTGLRGGMGHPEILCDERHAQVLIPFVNAAMKKVKKTSADRDQVPEACLTVMEFYESLVCRLVSLDSVVEERALYTSSLA